MAIANLISLHGLPEIASMMDLNGPFLLRHFCYNKNYEIRGKGSARLSDQKTAVLNKMVEEISQKLNMLNISVIKAEDFSDEKLDDLEYLHQMVMKKKSFSPSEMQAIAEELAALRK